MENEPIGDRKSPLAVGVLALIAAGMAVLIDETGGTWPTESSGLTATLLILLGILLIGYAWRVK